MSLRSITLLGLTALFAGNVQAALFTYSSSLSGAAEDPPNGSAATGTAIILYDDAAHTLVFNIDFAGLTAPPTAAHLHCCTALPKSGNASVAVTSPSLPGFPVGLSSGTYNATFDLTLAASFNSQFLTNSGGTLAAAEAALAAGLASERAYFNIHNAIYPAGEIRGFPTNAAPEPSVLSLLGLGLLAGLTLRRRS
ncbi:MAG: PEP-CTERM sorting domain-containing protein [Betaproteobacteria bacterium HGW-Betaproteobacteria-13]|jgi:hypothetical protein|uniref:PEP-CTERM sorting domain-containing protein n=1 Tax=Parazoarcus communis TaxID=41977 RepID=A0A2U8H185_9RHOO|nr:CHRD domain-containing protein [Parazoarcus communis]AWI79333.1 PEP-CTERM sorting domain-containing protein [Parazoarcus communis]PKO81681.1 MAG: PEP-CTERM sorting domain-containing protein [Betaproteobacteria bacterium HGW-Betaproteobacteria-13]